MGQLSLYDQQGWPYTDRRAGNGSSTALEHGRSNVETIEAAPGPDPAAAPWKEAYGDWSEYGLVS